MFFLRRQRQPAATYLVVRWTDHDPHARNRGWAEACINTVDPADERLTPCTPRPWP